MKSPVRILLTVICHPKQLLSCEAVLFEKPVHWNSSIHNAPFCRVKFKELKLNMVWFASRLPGAEKEDVALLTPE